MQNLEKSLQDGIALGAKNDDAILSCLVDTETQRAPRQSSILAQDLHTDERFRQ